VERLKNNYLALQLLSELIPSVLRIWHRLGLLGRLKVQKSSSIVLSYKIKHSSDVGIFIIAYQQLLQREVNNIWSNSVWIDKKGELYPVISEEKKFKNS